MKGIGGIAGKRELAQESLPGYLPKLRFLDS